MPVNTTTNKVIFTGDGATDIFPYTFKIWVESDMVVERVLIADGTTTAGTLNTHYTISGEGTETGGNVTTIGAWENTPATYKIVLRRELPITQLIDLEDNEGTPAATFEEGYDRSCMIDQQLEEKINRALLQISTSITSITFPAASDGMVIGWSGTTLTNIDVTGTGSLAKATQVQAEAGTDNDTYMTPLRTAQAIAAISGGGFTTGTFVNGDLSTGVLTITHGAALSAPYTCPVVIVDNGGIEVLPDSVTGSANSVAVDLTSYGTLSGTWGYAYSA